MVEKLTTKMPAGDGGVAAAVNAAGVCGGGAVLVEDMTEHSVGVSRVPNV